MRTWKTQTVTQRKAGGQRAGFSTQKPELYPKTHHVGYLVVKSVLLWAFFEHIRLSLANHIVLPMLHIHLRGNGAIGIFEAMMPSDSISHYYRKIAE